MSQLISDPMVTIASVCTLVWFISTVVHLYISVNYSRESITRLIDVDGDDQRYGDEHRDEMIGDSGAKNYVESKGDFIFMENQIDGLPIDVEKYRLFVRNSGRWITCLAGCAIALFGMQHALLRENKALHLPDGLSGAFQDPSHWPIFAGILLWVNMSYYAVQALRNRICWLEVKQLACLSFTGFVAYTSVLVIPGTIIDDQVVFFALQTTMMFTVLCIAIFIPSGPRYAKQTPNGPKLMARVSHKGKTIFSQLWFTNAYDIIRLVRKNGSIDANEAPLLGSDFDAHLLHMKFQRQYEKAMAVRKSKRQVGRSTGLPSILYESWPITLSLVKANFSILLVHNCLCVLVAFGWFIPSLVSFRIVRFLETTERQSDELISGPDRLRFGFSFCLLLAATILLHNFLVDQTFSANTVWLQNRVRTQLQMAIFSKALRKKDVESVDDFKKGETPVPESERKAKEKDEKDEAVSGCFSKAQVINMASVDAERISRLRYMFTLFNAPVEVIIGGFFAINLLGWAAVVGLASSFALQPILYFIGKATLRLEEKHQKARDKRTALLNEVMQAIRIVKFNAWEPKISARIQFLRDEELHNKKWIHYVEIIQKFIFICSPTLAILVSFSWYLFVENKQLTPSVAFTSLVVLDEMRFALTLIPEAITEVTQSFVSLRRINQYLESDEVEVPTKVASASSRENIAIVSGTIRWPKDEATKAVNASIAVYRDKRCRNNFSLKDINLEFIPNSLNLIVGRLGSGKTLLIKALMGEADILTGQVFCPRSLPDSICTNARISKEVWMRSDQLAYVPQTAFLINASLRRNILFGLPFSEERYYSTVRACGLQPDLKLLKDGDETEIGENGIGLSGGQTSRVMLARAIYSRAGTLILDDPLSAVDTHTAAHIHTNLLRGPLCEDRTVILVTHQVQLVAPSAKKVVMLNDGKVEFSGNPMKFVKLNLYNGLTVMKEQGQSQKEKNVVIEKIEEAFRSMTGNDTVAASSSTTPLSPVHKCTYDVKRGKASKTKTCSKVVEIEHRAKGAVLLSIYTQYLKACGGYPVVLILLSTLIASNCTVVVVKRWIQFWTEDISNSLNYGGLRQHSDAWWLSWLCLIWSADIVLKVVQMYILIYAGLKASKSIFTDMLRAVIQAPIRFHDTVSRGRLLNRFVYDLGEMDAEVMTALKYAGEQLITIIVTFATITTGGGAQFLIFFALMIPLYVIVGRTYLLATRDLKRLSSTTRSPILNAFGDLIRGSQVVRAFGGSEYFYRIMVERMNENMLYNYWTREIRYWYEELFNTFSFFGFLFAMIFILLNTSIKASQAGFVFAFLIHGHVHLLLFLRAIAELEQKLVSVERIAEYTHIEAEIDKEPEGVEGAMEKHQLPLDWPARGEVSVDNLHVRYASGLPEVLHGLSFKIHSFGKVGVVGPTGCGKSTLASSFFRFVEKTKGSIKIDDIDIETVNLRELRSRIQIVPQDATIFSGTLRANLDILDQHTDDEIYEALRKVHLILPSHELEMSGDISDGDEDDDNPNDSEQTHDFSDLNFVIYSGGCNLSTGEKQLLCLARAILKNCKLVIFDEATSSIDLIAETIITRTIHQAFQTSTIITIAHRLRTIINYDHVLVMDKGVMIEFGKPSELLCNPTSKFHELCRASGKEELAHLKQVVGAE